MEQRRSKAGPTSNAMSASSAPSIRHPVVPLLGLNQARFVCFDALSPRMHSAYLHCRSNEHRSGEFIRYLDRVRLIGDTLQLVPEASGDAVPCPSVMQTSSLLTGCPASQMIHQTDLTMSPPANAPPMIWQSNRSRSCKIAYRARNGTQGQIANKLSLESPANLTTMSRNWPRVKAAPSPDTHSAAWQSNMPNLEVDNGFGGVMRVDRAAEDVGDYQLADWTGGFAPPLPWEGRPQFNDRFLQCIRKWHAGVDHEPGLVQFDSLELKNVGHEIASRAWIPEEIEGLSAAEWWTDHIRSPESEHTPGSKPWWLNYIVPSAEFLKEYVVPNALLDPADNDPTKTSMTSATAILKLENKRLRKNSKKSSIKGSRARIIEAVVPPPNPYEPNINMFLRPATRQDMLQITDLYNYYIDETVFCTEMRHLTTQEMTERWLDVKEVRLPFFVAVRRTGEGTKSGGRYDTQHPEIIGFAFADDYCGYHSMYRYAVEIEIYVKPRFYRKGVGRCMLDKIVSVLDSLYLDRGGYDFLTEDPSYCSGGARVIGSIIINAPYADSTRKDWLISWLKQFDFEQCGDYADIGIKRQT